MDIVEATKEMQQIEKRVAKYMKLETRRKQIVVYDLHISKSSIGDEEKSMLSSMLKPNEALLVNLQVNKSSSKERPHNKRGVKRMKMSSPK